MYDARTTLSADVARGGAPAPGSTACSRRSCRAAFALPRHPATAGRSRATAPSRAAPRRTRRWRRRSSTRRPRRAGEQPSTGRATAGERMTAEPTTAAAGSAADSPRSSRSATSTTASVELPICGDPPQPVPAAPGFEQAELGALAASIAEHGVLQPVLVTQTPSGYRLIAGERRAARRRDGRASNASRPSSGPPMSSDQLALGADREPPARRSERARGGARLPAADRRVRADPGGGRRARRPVATGDHQHAAPARPRRRRSRRPSATADQRGPRAGASPDSTSDVQDDALRDGHLAGPVGPADREHGPRATRTRRSSATRADRNAQDGGATPISSGSSAAFAKRSARRSRSPSDAEGPHHDRRTTTHDDLARLVRAPDGDAA